MTKTTARHRAPLTPRGRLTRLWSTMSALPVGALAGCVAVGAAAATSSPEVGALGLGVALAPAALTSWRSRLATPGTGHGRRSARAAAPVTGLLAPSASSRQVERTLAPRAPSVSLSDLLTVPAGATADRPERPAVAQSPTSPARATGRRAAVTPATEPVAASLTEPAVASTAPLRALGSTPAAARTPIVLDVPDLAALHAATGQEHVWHGRSPARPEDDPSRLFTVSSSGGAVEVVVLTRAERADRDLEALSAMAAAAPAHAPAPAQGGEGVSPSEPAPAVMVRMPTTRQRPRRRLTDDAVTDDGLADAA